MTARSRALTITLARAPERAGTDLSADELAAAAGISRAMLMRLVRSGLVEPVAHGRGVFTAAAAARLRRMRRLRADLGVNLVGAAIILDLVDRLDHLHAELKERRRWIRTV
jgi:DNA-binding transcriptional MerR regulator